MPGFNSSNGEENTNVPLGALNVNDLLHMVNRAAALLLTTEDDENIETSLLASMEFVGNVVAADRVQIWRNEMIDGDLHFVLTYEWLSAVGKQKKPVPMGLKISYKDKLEWEKKFLRGECISKPLSQMSPDDQAMLNIYEIKTIIIIPLFIKEQFWGLFSIDDCTKERHFTKDEITILQSISLMMVSVINRCSLAAKINEAHDRAKILLDATPLGCQLWDKDLKMIDCNEEAIRLFGFTDKQEYMARYSEFWPEFQNDGQRSEDIAAMNLEKVFIEGGCIHDWTYTMLDGSVMQAEIILVRVKHGDDFVIAVYIRDMREHNKMMKAVEYRDSLLQALNHAATFLFNSDMETFEDDLYKSMGIIAETVKVDRVYVWKNKIIDGQLCHTQLCEWSEGAEPQKDKAYTVDLPYSAISQEWEKFISSGICINGLVRDMPLKERALFSMQGIKSLIVAPIFIKDRFWGIVGFDDCHSERVFTEKEESILRSGGLLFANALIRNEMVQNIRDTSLQLEAAFEQATAASKAKGDFLSNMSHEMRTPLNAIIGMTTIGKNAKDIEHKNHALNKIGDASSHLLGVISDVLDMAKIEANKLELAPIEYNFKKMLQKVISVVNFRIEEKRQMLSVNVDNNIPHNIVGDDQRLAQVITNLLANAMKFTPEGGEIYLEAFLIGEDDGTCELRIEVADSGIGISAEQQERIFMAFEQAESGTSRTYGGTGLGLVISKRIVELMDGRIWIESELGKGARFIFTVKARRGSEKNYSETNDEGQNENTVYIDGEFDGKRLLVAEDIEINREILITLLENSGLIIDCAENGKEALDMIAASPEKYDMVFMDLQMPQMDGLEASRRIRALPDRSHGRLPIIAMTANVFKDDIDACFAAGMDDHIGKPLDIDRVLEKLRKYLR